jgi:hypothetical protein
MAAIRPVSDPAPEPFRALRGLIPRALVGEMVDTLKDLLRAAGAQAADDDPDALVDDLRARDRGGLGHVYDAVRDCEVFRRLVTCEPLAAAARDMTGAERLHSPFQHAVFRMDLAGEAWRGFGWHQDFPYNVLSRTSVTAWFPLTPSGAANGGVDIARLPAERLYPVEIRYKRDGAGRRLATRDAFIAPAFHAEFEAAAYKPELAPGDVLIFHNTVVHRSGFNPGPRHRYSVQVRFGDLFAPEVVARGWRHRSADGFDTFAELHPELVAFKED